MSFTGKRVFFPMLSLGSFGGVRKILEIANHLSREYEVIIAYPKGRGDTPFEVSKSIKMVEGPFKNRFLHLLWLILYLNNEEPDVVVANFFPTAYLRFFYKGNMLYFVQDLEYKFYDNLLFKFLAWFSYLLPIRKVTYNPAICKEVSCEDLIPPGVDKRVFCPSNVKKTKNTIAYIPRKEKRKGWEVFYRSILLLRDMGLDFEVVLIGGTDVYDTHLEREGIRFKHLYPKDDRELKEIYSSVGIFVLTSRVEGLGFPVLESLCCGTPVVATGVMGSEVWGDMVALCEYEPEDIAKKIIEVLTHYDEYLRITYEHIENIPSSEDMAESFRKVIASSF